MIHHDIITSSSEYFHSILLKPSFVICAECGPARVYARVLSPVIIFYCVYTGEHSVDCVDVDDRFWPIFQPRAALGSCQTSQPSKHLQAGVSEVRGDQGMLGDQREISQPDLLTQLSIYLANWEQ